MFNNIFNAIIGGIDTARFSAELRKVADDFTSWIPDTPAQGRTTSTPSTRSEWTAQDLRQTLHALASDQRALTTLPRTIDFANLGYAIHRLREQASDGREYGRMCYIRLHDRRFEFGETARGSRESVSIPYEYHPLKRPAIMFHTHPQEGGAVTSCHFSPQDFISFLGTPSLFGSVVITPRAQLLLVRTERTPEFENIRSGYFEEVYDRVAGNPFVPFERKQARATQAICKSLNIGLYLCKGSANNFIFNQIEVKG